VSLKKCTFRISNFQPLLPPPSCNLVNTPRPSGVQLRPLFSGAYKTLISQPLTFHIHTKPPGCYPSCSANVSVLRASLPRAPRGALPFRSHGVRR
jgi:hypothetical protein